MMWILKECYQSEASFKRSTMDNIQYIYFKPYSGERKKQRCEDKFYAIFINLKAGFDNVNREIIR